MEAYALDPIWESELEAYEMREVPVFHINCPYCQSSYSTYDGDYTCKHCGEDLSNRDVREEDVIITLDTKAGIVYVND